MLSGQKIPRRLVDPAFATKNPTDVRRQKKLPLSDEFWIGSQAEHVFALMEQKPADDRYKWAARAVSLSPNHFCSISSLSLGRSVENESLQLRIQVTISQMCEV